MSAYREHVEDEGDRLRRRECPACGNRLIVADAMFFTLDVGYMAGLLCSSSSCKALWDDPANSFIAAVKRSRKSEAT